MTASRHGLSLQLTECTVYVFWRFQRDWIACRVSEAVARRRYDGGGSYRCWSCGRCERAVFSGSDSFDEILRANFTASELSGTIIIVFSYFAIFKIYRDQLRKWLEQNGINSLIFYSLYKYYCMKIFLLFTSKEIKKFIWNLVKNIKLL